MNLMDKEFISGMVSLLNDALDAKQAGNPIITEEQFNVRLNDLKQIEEETGFALAVSPTQRVNPVILPELNKSFHSHPVWSENECNTIEEIAKNNNMVAIIKLGGIDMSLTYKDGMLIRAVTRGDGLCGFDVTEHVKQFRNVPIKIKKDGFYIVNGTAIITDEDFSEISSEFKNSTTAAYITTLDFDTSLCYNRKLKFYVWDVVEGGDDYFFDSLHNAEELGFDVVPYWSMTTVNKKKVETYISHMIEYAKEEMLPYNGAMFRFNDIKYGKTFNYYWKTE